MDAADYGLSRLITVARQELATDAARRGGGFRPAMADARHRILMRGRLMPDASWLFMGTADWRSGLPYSVVDEDLDFVGPRNSLRFPTYFRVDAGFERRMTVGKLHPWVGLRVSNALSARARARVPMDPGIIVIRPEHQAVEFVASRFREDRIVQLGRSVFALEHQPERMFL